MIRNTQDQERRTMNTDNRLRLTDEEREAISVVADWASEHLGQDDPGVVALRALMERLK